MVCGWFFIECLPVIEIHHTYMYTTLEDLHSRLFWWQNSCSEQASCPTEACGLRCLYPHLGNSEVQQDCTPVFFFWFHSQTLYRFQVCTQFVHNWNNTFTSFKVVSFCGWRTKFKTSFSLMLGNADVGVWKLLRFLSESLPNTKKVTAKMCCITRFSQTFSFFFTLTGDTFTFLKRVATFPRPTTSRNWEWYWSVFSVWKLGYTVSPRAKSLLMHCLIALTRLLPSIVSHILPVGDLLVRVLLAGQLTTSKRWGAEKSTMKKRFWKSLVGTSSPCSFHHDQFTRTLGELGGILAALWSTRTDSTFLSK